MVSGSIFYSSLPFISSHNAFLSKTLLCYVDWPTSAALSMSFLFLILNILHPSKLLIPGQIRMVGNPCSISRLYPLSVQFSPLPLLPYLPWPAILFTWIRSLGSYFSVASLAICNSLSIEQVFYFKTWMRGHPFFCSKTFQFFFIISCYNSVSFSWMIRSYVSRPVLFTYFSLYLSHIDHYIFIRTVLTFFLFHKHIISLYQACSAFLNFNEIFDIENVCDLLIEKSSICCR